MATLVIKNIGKIVSGDIDHPVLEGSVIVITENRGAIPNMPYDAMVELPAYIGKNGPEVIARDNIPLFQQGLMMQQLNSEKLLVEGCVEGSYEKVLQAFTLNKTVPSMNVAKAILDDMIEANKGYWPELH